MSLARADDEARHRRNVARWKVLGAVVTATLFVLPFKVAADDGHGAGAALGLLAFVCILFGIPAAVRATQSSKDTLRRSWSLGWRIALAAAAGNIAQGYAFSTLHAGVAAVLIQTSLLFVALLGFVWLGEPTRRAVALGIVLTLLGVAATQIDALTSNLQLNTGVFWALAAAFGFALIDVISRKGSQGTDPMVTNVVRAALAVVVLAFVPHAVEQLLAMGPQRWFACALAALLGPGLGRLLLLSASKDLPAVESALLQQTRPLLAIPISSLYFSVWPTGAEWLGCGLIFVGLVLPLVPAELALQRRDSRFPH